MTFDNEIFVDDGALEKIISKYRTLAAIFVINPEQINKEIQEISYIVDIVSNSDEWRGYRESKLQGISR